jgi:hypothetical protein
MMDPLVVGPVAGALIALAGVAFATYLQYLSERRQRTQKTDELFFQALVFLGGGSQERNVGISAIKLFWADTRHKDLVISLLIGSAIYLISESKQKDAAHELYNLQRIMELLKAVETRNLSKSVRKDYAALQSTLTQKIASNLNPTQQGGLFVETKDLVNWQSDVTALLKEV